MEKIDADIEAEAAKGKTQEAIKEDAASPDASESKEAEPAEEVKEDEEENAKKSKSDKKDK